MGLTGVMGRAGEKRWMKQYYEGRLRIQSYDEIVIIENNGKQSMQAKRIEGTEVYLRLKV